MRRAIRVYAIVALVAMGALAAGLWAHPESIMGGPGGVEMALGAILGLQLWVLLVVPLGVLAASDAAHGAGRGWLTLFIALIILAPLAAWISPLTNNIQILLSTPCLPNAACPSGPYGTSLLVTQVGWVVAFLPVPIATLVYSLTPPRGAAELATAEAGQGERRTLIVFAIAGIVIMSALGYLGTSPFLYFLFAHFRGASFTYVQTALNLQHVLFTVWIALLSLPVAIASAALAHAARTGRHAWLASWIAFIALALLAADLISFWGEILILKANGATSGQISSGRYAVSIVTPVVVMLVALVYAFTVARPRPHAAALAAA